MSDTRDRACPACKAKHGEPCYTPIDGIDTQWDHDARILAPLYEAIRAGRTDA